MLFQVATKSHRREPQMKVQQQHPRAGFSWSLPTSRKPAARMTVPLAAPKTGQHTTTEELRREALGYFFSNADSLKCTPTSGGVNNVVQYVDTPEGKRYILRIYNNGNKSEKVVYEHEVLRQLSSQKLSFEIPRAVPALKDGATHKRLSSGTEACVFELMPGQLAKTAAPEEVGRATGELCTALASVKLGPGPIAPYWDIYAVHWSMNRDLFYQQVKENPEMNACREAIDYLAGELQRLEASLERYKAMDLPMQVIHGDVHYDNCMVLMNQDCETVSGILDFEFATFDWRLMELAVGLSKYVGEADPLPFIQQYVRGYARTSKLTDAEIQIIPDAIALRIHSNVVYFTGRAYAGEDGIDSLTSRAATYAKRVRWINSNKDAIINTIREAYAAANN